MDDNLKELIEKYVEAATELEKLRASNKILLKILWGAELEYANGAKQLNFKYNNDLHKAEIRISTIRDIFGFMPNPEALEIYKGQDVKEESVKEEEKAEEPKDGSDEI